MSQWKRPLIAIGICTRQRNALLRRLLQSIWKQPVPPRYDVTVVIVDNNDKPSVTPEVIVSPPQFKVILIHEANAGLVNARNKVLDAATEMGADWLIGVDDDTWVAPDWLEQFTKGFETLDAHILVAARHILYPTTTSRFSARGQQDQLPAGEDTRIFSTANFAISKYVFDPQHGPGLRFDPFLNESGGEDFEFMLRAKHQYGIRAVRWPYAIATEEFDGKRALFRNTLRRVLLDQLTRHQIAARHYKNGVRGTRLEHTAKLFRLTNRFVIFGTGNLIAGAFYLLICREDAFQIIGKGMLRWARALAIFPYIFGVSAVHYGASVSADRTAEP